MGEALALVLEGLTDHQLHTHHPRCFGLFDPTPATLAVAADALVSAFNPQLSVTRASPFAGRVEERLLHELAVRFGWGGGEGTFTSGGAEANSIALTVALHAAHPTLRHEGLRGLPWDPVAYVSEEAHGSFARAWVAGGLGERNLRVLPCDGHGRLVAANLAEAAGLDRAEGRHPFFVLATVGTTASGAVDPVGALADVCRREDLWLHVDAAWGGLGAFVPSLGEVVDGIAQASSLTFDPHKALAMPRGTGVYLGARRGGLARAFTPPEATTRYMPGTSILPGAGEEEAVDPYRTSPAWSRRFAGLRLLLPLATAGWRAFEAAAARQVSLGARLRRGVEAQGWQVFGVSPLPVVCFRGPVAPARVRRRLLHDAGVWTTTVRLAGETWVRACITSHRATEGDVDAVLAVLASLRRAGSETAT